MSSRAGAVGSLAFCFVLFFSSAVEHKGDVIIYVVVLDFTVSNALRTYLFLVTKHVLNLMNCLACNQPADDDDDDNNNDDDDDSQNSTRVDRSDNERVNPESAHTFLLRKVWSDPDGYES